MSYIQLFCEMGAGLDSYAGKPGGGSAAREQSGAGCAWAGLWTGWTSAAAVLTSRSKARGAEVVLTAQPTTRLERLLEVV